MPRAPTAKEIAQDAHWLAQALDPAGHRVGLVAMDRESYRQASFLDDRMLRPDLQIEIVPWAQVETALEEGIRQDGRWIFHIGHVGSTLVSRLLGEIDHVLAVREPRLLRDLALSPPEIRARYAGAVPRLMSRTFAPDEIACIKATSFVSEIAPELVPPGERALFMFAAPRTYVASILAGENSVKELRMLAASRASRMQRRVAGQLSARTDADLAALAWACEMTALERASDEMTDRVIRWEDFDRMLDDMPAALRRAADHFGFAADDGELARIASGPLMQRYSKALEYEYSPDLRRQLVAQAERYSGPQIDAALAMLRSAADTSPLLARALARTEN